MTMLAAGLMFDNPDAGPPEGVRAFPGATGLAALTRGAAGFAGAKNVAIVNTLADSGAGSFRAAVEGAGREGTFVVFTVSGIIELLTPIQIISDNITIAGQTSPGGICTAGSIVQVGGQGVGNSDVIIRHMRFRPGSHIEGGGSDNEGLRIWSANNVMIDHCSVSWGGDENMSLTSFGGTTTFNVTLARCIISQSLQDPAPEADHNYGTLVNFQAGGNTNSVDFHHCYWPHHTTRTPRMAGNGYFGIYNCVIYDWDRFFIGPFVVGQNAEVNWVGNVTRVGVNSEGPYTGPGRSGELASTPDLGGTPYAALYMNNNFGTVRLLDTDPEWAIVNYNTSTLLSTAWRSLTAFTPPAGGIDITPDAINESNYSSQAEAWLADCGATQPARDSHDTAMVNDFINSTGNWLGDIDYSINPELWPTYANPPPPTDTDGDGIPDSFEQANGFDITGMNPLAVAPSGYLWIEEYINSLA